MRDYEQWFVFSQLVEASAERAALAGRKEAALACHEVAVAASLMVAKIFNAPTAGSGPDASAYDAAYKLKGR